MSDMKINAKSQLNKLDGVTLDVNGEGAMYAKTATSGESGNVGVVKPDGSTITILTDGTISATGGGGGGYAPDMTTIDLTDDDKLRLKGATGYVKTDGDQNVAGVKTFTATDVHSQGISVTGADSKLTLEKGEAGSTEPGENVKINMGLNYSGIDPGAGGDLSLILYGTGTAVTDVGLGITSNALNIKIGAGAGRINHFVGTKNVCSMTANGMDNVVLRTRASSTVPITATTELGVVACSNGGNNRGLEFRLTATVVSQIMTNGINFYFRHTADNGQTWTSSGIVLTDQNSGWV
jgi:hypothetical protein